MVVPFYQPLYNCNIKLTYNGIRCTSSNYENTVKTVIMINSININKTNNHLSSHVMGLLTSPF